MPDDKKILCIHHNDADGRLSAAIVRRALGPDVVMHEMVHGDPLPREAIQAADTVVVVDFCLPPEDMRRIAGERELIWIDHHITAIEELHQDSQGWPGIRDISEAACVLTWRCFFLDQPLPRAVVLVGDRDIWRWAEADTGPFDEGLHQEDTSPTNDALWVPLLDDDPQLVAALIERGRVLRDARLKEIRRQVEKHGFPVIFDGHRTLAINQRGSGEMGVCGQELGYPLVYCYVDGRQNGGLFTFVTLYSSSIDVSEIARRYGGGGHRGAAGFSFERGPSPFPPGSDFHFLE